MQQITRKVVSSQQLRESVERARVHDAWMSTLILLLDPFQRAIDRPGQTDWFGLAQYICTPADRPQMQTEAAEENTDAAELDEITEAQEYNPERYLDPVYDRYREFRQ